MPAEPLGFAIVDGGLDGIFLLGTVLAIGANTFGNERGPSGNGMGSLVCPSGNGMGSTEPNGGPFGFDAEPGV